MPDSTTHESHHRSIRGSWAIYAALCLAGLAPILVLGVYTYQKAASALTALVQSNNESAALITQALVEQESGHWANTVTSFSRMPGLGAIVQSRDEDAMRDRLRILVESHPRIVRAFVTDPQAVLWSDYPKAPESIGSSFAYRDWYAGLSANWETFISGVYRRHAEPKLLLVAIAAAVRDSERGEVVGAVVCQVTLDTLTDLLRDVRVGQSGYVFVVDDSGTVAAHPRLDLQAREYAAYAETALLSAARTDSAREIRYTDPISQTPMIASALPCNVQGHTWTVVAQQPEAEALLPIQNLREQIAGAGVLFGMLMTGISFMAARYHIRTRDLNAQLGTLNRELTQENSARQRAEEALQEANLELGRRVEERTRELRDKEEQFLQSQKMEAVGRLAGGVAHDFNNLLTIITGYAEIVLGQIKPGDPLRGDIESIQEAGQSAASLTRQLLAFSRRQILHPERLDLNGAVRDMEKMLQRLIGEDIDLIARLEGDLWPVMFDRGQIEQILMNLAVNARDAMPNGGKLTIETGNIKLDDDYASTHGDAQPGPHVMLAVTDTGIGMDAEIRAQIFEPFFTTKELGRGTGLGLSTVYGIVKQSGGNIWVYSEPGRGTTFKVYLPRATSEEAAGTRPIETIAASNGSETILLVEDEEAVRVLVRRVLESSGYHVLETAKAEDAIDVARDYDGTIHLLLTDVVMPKMGGPEVAQRVTELRPGIKVVYMSGYTDDAIVRHGVLEEGMAFLEKPLNPTMLRQKIREFLG